MNFWIEKTIVEGRADREFGDRALGKALWSPRTDKRGADIYKFMREVKAGDIIIHLIDNQQFSGISIAKQSAVKTDGIEGTVWDRGAYMITLKDYKKLEKPLDRKLLLNSKYKKILEEISDKSQVFYNKDLNLRQGAYLTPCPKELLSLINNVYKELTSLNLPYYNIMELQTSDYNNFISSENNVLENNTNSMINSFNESLKKAGLIYSPQLIARFIASLTTKPFVILTGLSGSGKTKLAQAFAQWICESEAQYCIVPVGADWTNREPLLGYENALESEKYMIPENGALELIINANNDKTKPYFLILDEMNLSHVERYFADFLSIMESKGKIKLHSSSTPLNKGKELEVEKEYDWPKNLFIVGTVNIDETTYMFSPKVLDRANTIEFRVSKGEIEKYFKKRKEVVMELLKSEGELLADKFLGLTKKGVSEKSSEELTDTEQKLLSFFNELKKTGAEFGYRTASEMIQLMEQLTAIDKDITENEKLDIAIMQKLLPKLHGSRRKLIGALITLGKFCVDEKIISNIEEDVFNKEDFEFNSKEPNGVTYSLSLEKLARMYNGVIQNGFTSYAEA